MADFNLEATSLKELRQLQKDLAKAIATYEDRHKAEARAKPEVIAREMHPENAALTWSGRSREPNWFVEALQAGKTPGEPAIG